MALNTATRRDDKITGVWQAPGIPVTVEYSTQVLEELRAAAEEGFQKIPHGGLEVGALLLGTRDAEVVRVLEWRPIECEHAKGPGFVLSAKDLAGLEALLSDCQQAPELRSLQPVGWFHTHTRSKIFLSPDDLVIHNRFFNGAGDVALVMRLTKDQPATAGFFLRDAAGALQPEASPLEFTVTPDPAALLGPTRLTAARRGAPNRRERTARPANEGFASSAAAPPPPRRAPEPEPEPVRQEDPFPPPFSAYPPPPKRFGIAKIALALGGLAGIAALAWYAAGWMPVKQATAELRLEEIDGQLEVRWDRAARAIQAAERGAVTIQDGPLRTSLELSASDVQRGSVFYARTSDDLQVRLELFRGDTVILQEMARFLGQTAPGRSSARPSLPVTGRDKAREALDQAKQRLAGESERGDDLKRQIREAEEKLRRDQTKR